VPILQPAQLTRSEEVGMEVEAVGSRSIRELDLIIDEPDPM
jgi:hypothetical protein